MNPGLLGVRTVSEDAVRMAMHRIPEAAGLEWLSTQILASISPALFLPWILDIDVTVKPLYGHQEGAAIRATRRPSVARTGTPRQPATTLPLPQTSPGPDETDTEAQPRQQTRPGAVTIRH